MSRALATVVEIDEVRPHPNAERLEIAQVRGWQVVVQKDTFVTGDVAVYFEIDSALPVEWPQFAFLADRSTRFHDGVTVHVLKTIRLRGELSQGLLVPLDEFPQIMPDVVVTYPAPVNVDVTELLGITLYEPNLVNGPSGRMSSFPQELIRAPKTDAERVQNLPRQFFTWFVRRYADVAAPVSSRDWVATEKIDGSSATFAMTDEGEFIVASRNQRLDPDVGDNIWNQIAKRYKLRQLIPLGVTVQGEIYGEGIQHNPLALKGIDFACFAAWRDGKLLHYMNYDWLFETMMPLVPKIYCDFPQTLELALMQADGRKSDINKDKLAEGIVWTYYGDEFSLVGEGYLAAHPVKYLGERKSFKVISNTYLLKVSK